MLPSTIEDRLWAWLAACPLDNTYFGQLIITVRSGQVVEVEQRQTHRRPRQKPRPAGEERPEQPAPHP